MSIRYIKQQTHQFNGPYNSLKKRPLRVDTIDTNVTNELEPITDAVKYLFHEFCDPTVYKSLAAELVKTDYDADPYKPYAITITGYNLPMVKPDLYPGDVLAARYHEPIPEISLKIYREFSFRSTLTSDVEFSRALPSDVASAITQRQTKQHTGSFTLMLQFILYLIFTDLGSEIGNFDQTCKNGDFEKYYELIFKTNDSNHTPFADRNELALQRMNIPNIRETVYNVRRNELLEAIKELRTLLKTNSLTYTKANPDFEHDIPLEAKYVVALSEKVQKTLDDYEINPSNYRAVEKVDGFYIPPRRENIILILSREDELTLPRLVPEICKPGIFGLDNSVFRVKEVFFEKGMKKGHALGFDKDFIQIIIRAIRTGQASYPEQGITNIFMDMTLLLGCLEVLPCCYISPQ